MKTGECVSLDVLIARTVRDDKIETSEEEGPAGLSGVQAFSVSEVLQVLVVGNYFEWILGPFQPMPPFLQSELDGQ